MASSPAARELVFPVDGSLALTPHVAPAPVQQTFAHHAPQAYQVPQVHPNPAHLWPETMSALEIAQAMAHPAGFASYSNTHHWSADAAAARLAHMPARRDGIFALAASLLLLAVLLSGAVALEGGMAPRPAPKAPVAAASAAAATPTAQASSTEAAPSR